MQLKKIITLANKKTKIPFLAMERSLRATGCNLPIHVIPYDYQKFELPENSYWWEMEKIIRWLSEKNAFPTTRKYQCFTTENYQYIDTDAIFLKNPEDVLRNLDGFITSCTHWNNPGHTYTRESLEYLKNKTTTWQRLVFNAGQYACDRKLYEEQELIEICQGQYRSTLLDDTAIYKDQAAINLLVGLKDISITNLTLPPHNMESTWGGNYQMEDYKKYWTNDNKPYLIHWAGGGNLSHKKYINQEFYKFLKPPEEEKLLTDEKSKTSSLETKLKSKVKKWIYQ